MITKTFMFGHPKQSDRHIELRLHSMAAMKFVFLTKKLTALIASSDLPENDISMLKNTLARVIGTGEGGEIAFTAEHFKSEKSVEKFIGMLLRVLENLFSSRTDLLFTEIMNMLLETISYVDDKEEVFLSTDNLDDVCEGYPAGAFVLLKHALVGAFDFLEDWLEKMTSPILAEAPTSERTSKNTSSFRLPWRH